MGCFSPPGDERLEKRLSVRMPRPRGTRAPWVKVIQSLYIFFIICLFIFRVLLVIVHVLVVEMTSLSTLTFHLGIPLCLWQNMVPLLPAKLCRGQGPSWRSVSQLLGPSTNTQHPLRLHSIIFTLNYNSTDMDSRVEYSGSRQSRAALSPRLGLAEVGSCMNARQIMFFSAVGQNKQCSH